MFRLDKRVLADLPSVENGYELDPIKSFFSLVVPTGADATNIVINPSVEVNTTGYVPVVGGSIARDATTQMFGVYSLNNTPGATASDGVYYNGVALTSGTLYWSSVWFKGQAGLKYVWGIWSTVFTTQVQLKFVAQGIWQRLVISFQPTVTATYYPYLLKDNQTNTTAYNLDGLQVEATNLTTYIDGDQKGFVRGRADYYWQGTAHASPSVRISQSRAGGHVVALSDYNFHVTGMIGMGMGGRVNQLLKIGRGGASYGGSVTTDRQFALVGGIYGNSLPDLQRHRKALIDALKDDVVAPDQPLKILYQQVDDYGDSITPLFEIPCVVDGDPLAGQITNNYAEMLGLTFRALGTYLMQEVGEAATALLFSSSIANANNILQRSALGVWSALSTGTNSFVNALAYGPDGKLYVGGTFTSAGGVANTSGIATWDGVQWAALGTGVTGGTTVTSLVFGPDGSLYVGGQFTAMGGVANTARIAKWNGAAWSALATGANGAVNALAISTNGTLYAGGAFTLMSGVANTVQIARWNGAAWSAMGTGVGDGAAVRALTADALNGVYIGGDFTLINGSTVAGWAYWTGSSWTTSTLGFAGVGSPGAWAISIGPDGRVYFGGTFSSAGLISAANVAILTPGTWAKPQFTAMGSGAAPQVQAFGFDANGFLYVGGQFTIAGGLATPGGVAIWTGSTWIPAEISLPSLGLGVTSFALNTDGRFAMGFSTSVTATGPAVNTVTNVGTTAAGEKIIITGPGTFWRIANVTTGKVIYLNLTLLAGEVATLNLSDPTGYTFISSFRGNILNTIVAGSSPSDFTLPSGNSSIVFFMTGSTGASGVSLLWRNAHHSLDGGIPVNLNL